MNTALSLPLENLSVPEKLLLMERLWADLSRQPSDVPVPEWHGEILAERAAAVGRGEVQFVDWEAAKARLRARGK